MTPTLDTHGWTRNPADRDRLHRVFASADMPDGEESALEGVVTPHGDQWRWHLEWLNPRGRATLGIGQAPTLQLACARAALAADDVLAAMRAITRGEGEA
jgi:hypothetical protein